MAKARRVGLLLFDSVEVLDACGPFEVFATTKDETGSYPFEVSTVALSCEPIRAVGGLRLIPDFALAEAPPFDVFIIPGGVGRKVESGREELLAWLRQHYAEWEVLLTICTGAFIAANAELLPPGAVTTHHSAHEELATARPELTVLRNVRFVDRGSIVTAAGIAAGIDASLHLVGRLLGPAVARTTAERMEYPWQPAQERPLP